MDMFNRLASNAFSELERELSFEESTPRVVFIPWRTKNPQLARLGQCSFMKESYSGEKDVIHLKSNIFPATLYKPHIKFVDDVTDKELTELENQISELRKQRNEVIKRAWKKAKKPVWIDDVQSVEQKRKEILGK